MVNQVELYRRALLIASQRVDDLASLVEGEEVCPPGLECSERALDCGECWSLWFLDEAERELGVEAKTIHNRTCANCRWGQNKKVFYSTFKSYCEKLDFDAGTAAALNPDYPKPLAICPGWETVGGGEVTDQQVDTGFDNNCFGICVGFVMGINGPNLSVASGHGDELDRLTEWLRPRGLSWVEIEWDYDRSGKPFVAPDDCVWLMRVNIVGGTPHMAVCVGDRIVYDPLMPESGNAPIYVPLSAVLLVVRMPEVANADTR